MELDVWVAGRPRTKGSLRPVKAPGSGRVKMVEEVRQSSEWRRTIVNAAVLEISEPAAGGRRVLHGGWPMLGAVAVTLAFYFAPTAEALKTGLHFPITRYYGDVDKLTRNVLDALQDAHVYGDDAHVARLTTDKRWVPEDMINASEGVLIKVVEVR
jgi:hypothetical protein